METDLVNLKSGNGHVKIAIDGNLIYLKVFGRYTDVDVIEMEIYLENYFSRVNAPTIRIWDSRAIDHFELTSSGITQVALWSKHMQIKWPENTSYMIADSDFKFGMSRMYELKATTEIQSVTVIHKFNELPNEIIVRLNQIFTHLKIQW